MKKYLLSLLVTFLFAIPMMAQRIQPALATAQYKNVIKSNPVTLAFGDFNATWERVINDKNSYTLTFNLITGAITDDFSILALTAGYKYYFTHRKVGVPEGFYVRPLAGIVVGDGEFAGRVAGQLGYQWIWKSDFALDLGLGPQFILGDELSEGPLPSFFAAVGYAF